MRDKVFKGSIVLFMLLLVFVGVAGVSADDNSNDVTVLSISGDGVSFDYPSTWQNSRAISNYSVMAISKADSVDAMGVAEVTINLEKKPLEKDFYTFLNDTYDAMDRDTSFELVSSGGLVVDNRQAFEYIYTSLDDTGTQKQHKAVWFEKNGQAYVLLYSAPLDQFESNLYVFDYILSSVDIT